MNGEYRGEAGVTAADPGEYAAKMHAQMQINQLGGLQTAAQVQQASNIIGAQVQQAQSNEVERPLYAANRRLDDLADMLSYEAESLESIAYRLTGDPSDMAQPLSPPSQLVPQPIGEVPALHRAIVRCLDQLGRVERARRQIGGA